MQNGSKPPVLWHIEVSHYNEKARWALDHKGIPHVRKAPLPGLHGLWAGALTRGKQRRLPVLQIDGRTIGDSTAIIAALETRQPEPPLYPADPAERARALELEDWFDENLAVSLRAFLWAYTLDDPNGIVDATLPEASTGRRRFMRASAPLATPFVRADYKATAARIPALRAELVAAMDRIEAELQPSGYLVGDAFSVADLSGAALFTPLLCPPERPYPPRVRAPEVLELRAELEAREGGRWVYDMYARHRGTSSEIGARAGRTAVAAAA